MKAVIWSSDNCWFCSESKRIMESKGMEIEERVIGNGEWTKEDLLEAVPNANTVPQIFIDGEHVGGHDDLVKRMMKGE